MKLAAFVILCLLARPVYGTWSVIATDRATGQVGGAGATCRTSSDEGSSLLEDDFGSAAGRGALVGQDGAAHTGAWPTISVESGETYMQDSNPPLNGYPDQMINVLGFTGNNQQWAVVDLQGNVEVSTLPVVSTSADTTGHVRPDYTYSVQGNRLSSTDVVTNAEKEFRKKGKGKGGKGKGGGKKKKHCDDLPDRLMRAMEAAAEDEYGNIIGDSNCTPDSPADTAYLLVKKPDDSDDGTDQYARLDIVTEGGSNAIERLREAYDEWREENPCEKRPMPHERYYPALAAGGLIALLGLGIFALHKKKRVFIEGTFLDSLEDSHVAETQMTTPYSMEQGGIRA